MFSDAHCHLNEFKDPGREVEAARKENVLAMVSNSVDLDSMERNLALAKEFPGVECALGIHPSNLLRMGKAQAGEAMRFMEKELENAVAVGETGLDFKHAGSGEKRGEQERCFGLQLGIAERQGKPVIIHSRLAVGECIEVLEGYDCRALFHWFSGSLRELKRVLELGCYVSVGPAVLFSKAIQEITGNVPLDRLLAETDAPVPFRGIRSRPCWVPRVVGKLAEIRLETPAALEKQLLENFSGFFSLPAKEQQKD